MTLYSQIRRFQFWADFGFFFYNGQKITKHKWVLSLMRGYKLEFEQKAPFNGIKETKLTEANMSLLLKEIGVLLEKGAIEQVNQTSDQGFYSTLFWSKRKQVE